MSLSITYYAPTDSMGDTSEADAATFRSWAQEQLQAEYPAANVSVSGDNSTRQVAIGGAESPEQEEEIQDFVSRLWDRCPWDFN